MNRINSIGSLSEFIGIKKERKSKYKMSEQIRMERERLFGGIKRARKNILPSSKKDRRIKTLKISEEEIILSSSLIIEKANEILNLPIASPDNFRDTYNYLDMYIRSKPVNTRVNLRRDLICLRIIVCYIMYHCFNYEQNSIANFYGIHRDFTGAANQILELRFEQKPEEANLFNELFDYFMALNKREYA
jgi:hypothetical protein